MYMDDIKLFAKNEKDLKTLILTVKIYSQDMEFGIEKCAMLIMRNRKEHMMERIKLPNQEKIRMLGERETYKYMQILEVENIEQVKEKIKKEYLRRMRKLLNNKLNGRRLIKGINTWPDPFVRYSGPFLKWIREELWQTDHRTRELMMMHKVLHPRDDVDRLYVSRKIGGSRLTSVENSIDALIQHKKVQRMTDYSDQNQYKQCKHQQKKITRKQKKEEK